MFNIFLEQVSDQFDKVVISGDFNMPHIPWNTSTGDAPSASNSFIEALNDHFLTQINNIPTRIDNINIIDNDVETPSNAAVFTDQCVLHYEFNAFVKTAKSKTQRFVYNYKKGVFNGLCSSLSTINLLSYIEHANINDDWQSWRSTFLEAVSKYIPCIKLKERKDLPWINRTILNLIKKKSTVRKKLRSSPTSHLLEKFKHLRSKVKRMLRESREEFYVSLGNNYQKSPKRFWSGMKRHTKTRSIPNIISMAEVNNDQKSQTARIKAKSPEDIASLFNRYFASVFESDDAVNDTSYESKALVLSEIILTVEEVQAVLETL